MRDLLQHRVAHRCIGRDDAHAEDGALKQILLGHLGDGDVEARADAVAELLHDAPLVLERTGVRNVEREAEDSDEHRYSDAPIRASA